MEKSKSFLAVESLMDLSKKASMAKKREYEENENFCFYRNFVKLSWYSRLNIINMPEKDEKMLERIKTLCLEPTSPKYMSLSLEDCYEGIEEDMISVGFKVIKPQKGMLYSLENAPEYENDSNIVRITRKKLAGWVAACEEGFGKSGTTDEHEIFVNDRNCRYYGYMLNGEIVSTAILNICGKNGGIHEVATPKEFRNKGYATALIKYIINEAKAEGCEILSLQASVYGEPVYKSLGFEEVSHIINYSIE